MPYFYSLDSLTPLNIRIDEDGDTHAVYCLPSPKRWWLRTFIPGPNHYVETEQLVSRVRVCLGVYSPTNRPQAIVVPLGPDGRENGLSSVVFRDVVSIVGVLARMGFTLILSAN